MEILGRDGTLSLGQLIDRSGFVRQTVCNHLNHLITAGVVSKEAMRRGRGRPAILYSLSKHLVGGCELNIPEAEVCMPLREGWVVQGD